MSNNNKQFVHLHAHGDTGSLLDGFDTTKELVTEVSRLEQPAIALTDHGSLHGIYDLFKEAENQGVKPIAGQEFYLTPSHKTRFDKEAAYFADGGGDDVSGRGAYTHITILAENNKGLSNLFKLSTLAYSEGFFQKQRIDMDLLGEHAEGLIATTGCPSGEIQTKIRLGMVKEAFDHAAEMQDIFGKENYFLELMDHDMKSDLERKVRKTLLEIASKLRIPLLATNDLHYTKQKDCKAHEHMLAIGTGSVMSELPYNEGGKRFAFEGDSYYVKSYDEMAQIFPEDVFPGALSNTVLIAERVNTTIDFDDSLQPRVDLPDGLTDHEFLRQEAFAGLARRMPDKASDPVYVDRLNFELQILEQKKFSGYILFVSDFVRWAKFTASPPVPSGAGRGSAAGSLVCFATDITDVDPIPHKLFFERFINPERNSFPDVDADFNDEDRGRVIEYVTQKYGVDKTAQVVTFGKILAKSAIKDTVRVLERPYALGEKLTKLLPPPVSGRQITLAEVYDSSSERYAEGNEFRAAVVETESEDVLDIALQLEGRTRSTGVHAAALIVSSKPIVDTVPVMMRQADNAMITQWDYPTCESLGLVKVDFLGIRNLGVVTKAIAHVKRTRGITIDENALRLGPKNDKKTYDMLARGESLGVFQLDGNGIRDLLKRMRPDNFDDISASIALYRPGPMGVNAHNDYADRKNGLQEVIPIHPELEEPLKEILDETYNLCVAGDTMVYDATTGIQVRIDSIADKVKDGNFYTFGVDSDGVTKPFKVSHWVKTGKKKIYNIRSSNGKILRVSGNHEILTLSGYKKAEDLVAGKDRVAMPGSSLIPLENNNTTVEEARLLGYLIGDGSITLQRNYFTNNSSVLLEHVSDLAKGLFDDMNTDILPMHRVKGEQFYTNRLNFTAFPVGVGRGYGTKGERYTKFSMNQWLVSMGYDKKTLSAQKFVPKQIFGAKPEVIKHFISALWDTDGHVNESSTFLKTISKDLAYGVQDLLNMLGIHSSVLKTGKYYHKKTGSVRQSYGVYVYEQRFYDEILPLMKHVDKVNIVKKSKVKAYKHKYINANLMRTSMQKIILDTIPENRESRTLSKQDKAGLRRIWTFMKDQEIEMSPSRWLSHTNSEDALNLGKNSLAYLENYGTDEDRFYSTQNWSSVTSIEITDEEDVYDITVPVAHNFLANGIIVHNCIYQEEIMQTAQKLAGFTLAQADNLRRAMGKKKRAILEAEYIPFSDGMRSNGYSAEATKAIWDVLVPFAEYGFNKAHSVAYGVLSYTTAYLKANYPAEFMAALLSSVSDDADKTALYLEECRRMGLKVYPPDVTVSFEDYFPASETEIYFGLKAIRGIGFGAATEIVKTRVEKGNFVSFSDFMLKIPKGLANKRILEGLTYGGGFDSLLVARKTLVYNLGDMLTALNRSRKKTDLGQVSLFDDEEEADLMFDMVNVGEYERLEKLKLERHALGLYVSDNPLNGLKLDSGSNNKINELLTGVVEPFEGWGAKGEVQVAGLVSSLEVKRSRKTGDPFALGTLEDQTGSIQFIMFPKAYSGTGNILARDGIFQFSGQHRKDRDGDGIQFMVDSVRLLEFGNNGQLNVKIRLTQAQWVAGETELKKRLRTHYEDDGAIVQLSLLKDDGEIEDFSLDDFPVRRGSSLMADIRELFGISSIGRWRKQVPKKDESEKPADTTE